MEKISLLNQDNKVRDWRKVTADLANTLQDSVYKVTTEVIENERLQTSFSNCSIVINDTGNGDLLTVNNNTYQIDTHYDIDYFSLISQYKLLFKFISQNLEYNVEVSASELPSENNESVEFYPTKFIIHGNTDEITNYTGKNIIFTVTKSTSTQYLLSFYYTNSFPYRQLKTIVEKRDGSVEIKLQTLQEVVFSSYDIELNVNETPEIPTEGANNLVNGLVGSGHINIAWNSNFDDSVTKENYLVTSSQGRYYNEYNILHNEDSINNVKECGTSNEIMLNEFSNTNWEKAFYINSNYYGIINIDGFDGIYYTIDVNSANTSGLIFKILSFEETNNFTSGTYTFCTKCEELSGSSAPELYLIGQVHMDFELPSEVGLTSFNDTEYIALNRHTFYITYRLCSKEFYDYFNKYSISVSMSDSIDTITNKISLPTVNYRLLKLEERIDALENALHKYLMAQ